MSMRSLAGGRVKRLGRKYSGLVRFGVDNLMLAVRGGSASRVCMALVSDGKEYTSEQQLFPFSAFRQPVRDRLSVVSRRLDLREVLASPRSMLAPFSVIGVKLGFRTPRQEVLDAVRAIRAATAGRELIYFDGDDDLGVQWPELIEHVDLYVKKHAFRDRQQYLSRFVGKSNLTDYVSREFGQSFEDDPIATHSSPVSAEQLHKIVVGWNLAFDEKIIRLRGALQSNGPWPDRAGDIVCRAAMPPDWLRNLRAGVEAPLRSLEGRYKVIIPNKRVPPEIYLNEMLSSKICVSPFGYGEICWRDFEAVLCGCLLVKPSMDHVETYPDIFRAGETYVPVKWDFSDLEDRCVHYLAHPQERQRIVENARQALESAYAEGFADRVRMLLGE